MKTKNFLSILLILILSVSLTQAKIWRLDSPTAGTDPDFNTIEEAMMSNSVIDGDTLYLSGTIPATYHYLQSFTLEKRVTIYGPGYFLNQNPETQDQPYTAYVYGLRFGTGSEGSSINGVVLGYNTYIDVNNITISRCQTGTITIASGASNIQLKQSYISGTVDMGSNNSNIQIRNNILTGTMVGVNSNSAVIISHNVLYNNYTSVHNATINNNIIFNRGWMPNTYGNSIFNNVIKNIESQPWPTTNNTMVTTVTYIFAGTSGTDTYPGYSEDGKFELSEGSPAIGAGFDGVDCGIFGGGTPYVLSGLPAIPHIYFIDVSGQGTTIGGLPVHIKVKSQN